MDHFFTTDYTDWYEKGLNLFPIRDNPRNPWLKYPPKEKKYKEHKNHATIDFILEDGFRFL